ncbi:MAG: TSUP family transporter [Chitinophagaceae bacterium]
MTTQIIGIALLIGLFAGVLSGLVGVGGGIILVPALILFLKYDQLTAQGTSLAVLTLPVTLFACIHYYNQSKVNGHPFDMKLIGILALGFIIGGFIGGKLAIKIDREVLRKIFAVVLFYTGFKMMGWDLVIFKWIKNLFS